MVPVLLFELFDTLVYHLFYCLGVDDVVPLCQFDQGIQLTVDLLKHCDSLVHPTATSLLLNLNTVILGFQALAAVQFPLFQIHLDDSLFVFLAQHRLNRVQKG